MKKNLLTAILGRYEIEDEKPVSAEPQPTGMEEYFWQATQTATTLGTMLGRMLAHVEDVATHTGVKPKEDVAGYLQHVCESAGYAMDSTKDGKGGTWAEMTERLDKVGDALDVAAGVVEEWLGQKRSPDGNGPAKQVAAVKAAEEADDLTAALKAKTVREGAPQAAESLPSLAAGVQGEDKDLVDVCAVFDRLADEIGRAHGRAQKVLSDYGDYCGWGTTAGDLDTFTTRVVTAFIKHSGRPWDKRDNGVFLGREEFTANLVEICDEIKAAADNLGSGPASSTVVF